MNLFERTRDKRERDAGLKTEKAEPKKPAEKPKAGMSQADFSYGKEKKYAKGGMVKRGYGKARGGKC